MTQTSETMRLGALLSLSGGFMDAYSYLCRGKVFANAQTGNLLLLGVRLSEGDLGGAVRYLAPVLAFTLGIVAAEAVRRSAAGRMLHWRQLVVLLEAACLAAVCFLPQALNLPANSLTSFACGMQVESFRKIRGNGVATTMCIGNLRSGTEHLCRYAAEKDRASLRRALLYYFVIVCFVCGAVLGKFCIVRFAERAILFCCAALLLAFFLMFSETPEAPRAA